MFSHDCIERVHYWEGYHRGKCALLRASKRDYIVFICIITDNVNLYQLVKVMSAGILCYKVTTVPFVIFSVF